MEGPLSILVFYFMYNIWQYPAYGIDGLPLHLTFHVSLDLCLELLVHHFGLHLLQLLHYAGHLHTYIQDKV